MAEFQSRWRAEKKSGNAPQYPTDNTDSFTTAHQTVSVVSAKSVRISEKNLADRPPAPNPSVLSADEAEAVGLNPRLIWARVACAPIHVEPSTAPAGWNGQLPGGCCHRDLCSVLGICPHAVARCGAIQEKE